MGLLTLALPAIADYQAGLDAYSEGAYRLAMREWISVTEQPPSEVNPNIYAEAHYAVARLYWDGQGTTRDYFAAYDWLVKAADLGHAGAMAKLGYLYTDGLVVTQDFEQAFDWYSRAAKKGDVDGLYNLGVFYLNGWGTPPDRTMAKQYLAAASAQGDATAERALQTLLAQDDMAEPVAEAPGPTEPDLDATTDFAANVSPLENCRSGESRDCPDVDQPLQPSDSAIPDEASVQTLQPSRLKPLLQADSDPGFLLDESWILEQNPDHYTIQVIGLSTREKLESLVADREDLAPMAVYVVQRSTRPIHVLVQGVYPSVEDARNARDRFPSAVNPPGEVWIRQFSRVQAVIAAEQQQ